MEDILKKELYEYLDWYSFVNYDEVVMCVNDFFMEEKWELEPSMYDLLDYQDYAIEYIIERWLEFESDVVNWEDLNHVDDWKQRILDYKIQKRWTILNY